MENTSVQATIESQQDDRSQLLSEAVQLTIETAYGMQRADEQKIAQILGGLVRSKLMSADDSYALKDQLMTEDLLVKSIDRRIDGALRRQGVISNTALSDLEGRLSKIQQ